MTLTTRCSNHWISLAEFIFCAIDSDDCILKCYLNIGENSFDGEEIWCIIVQRE